eukprot:6230664-Amphidinium_carterae.1
MSHPPTGTPSPNLILNPGGAPNPHPPGVQGGMLCYFGVCSPTDLGFLTTLAVSAQNSQGSGLI